MAGKKTGLYLSPMAEEIVNKVAEKYGYTKTSNVINFIVLEYDKLTKRETKQEVVEKPVEEKVKPNYEGWFVSEDK